MNFLHKPVLFFPLLVFLFAISGSVGLLYADDLVHVVGRGETVYSISRFYSVSADDLMRANKITDPSRLQAGSRLIIPSSAETAVSGVQALTDYRVVRGDTLFSIARNNGISLQTLLDINKFSSSHVLRVGEVVKIPGRPSGNSSAVYSMRWPVTAKDIAYMTGQMGVVVEGEHNESVRSLTQGQVISAGPWRKFGRVVIVETTAGYLYMYGGCESLSVNVGDRISPGTEVGKLGINTVSNKPQLFFMVFRSDTPIDPALAPRT